MTAEAPETPAAQPLDRDFVRRAIDLADANALRVALYQATGDEELLTYRQYTEVLRKGAAERLALVPEDRKKLAAKAEAFLMEQAATFVPKVPDNAELKRLYEVYFGKGVTDEYVRSQRALSGFDELPYFAHEWDGVRGDIPEDFKVVIIGTGFSGISAGVQLSILGIPYEIYERRAEVGGVWSINRYPAVRVDTMSASYQLGFMGRYPWTEHFAEGKDVRHHIEEAARRFGVLDHIRFNHDVRSMSWDEENLRWNLTVDRGDESIEATASVVVSGTGLFATPRLPEFDGVDEYQGDILHTTAWPAGYSLAGKSVAVIGNGSTGVQLTPAVADVAERMSVFVRTPQWVSPREYYGDPIEPEHQWLSANMPYYWNWERVTWSVANMGALVANIFFYDREWQAKGGAISEHNDNLRAALIEYIKEETLHRPELYERLIPDYAPWSRRMIVDGGWYRTLTRDHVDLVTSPIDHLESDAIVTADGQRHEVDVIIAASGFSVNKYMHPIEVRGADGRTLEEYWEESGVGPRAFLSMAVPNFPNLFIMYGPNSQGGAPFPANMELWARYIAETVMDMLDGGHRRIEVKEEVFEEHNRVLDARTANMIFAEAGERNYYVSHGRVSVMAAWSAEEHWANMTEPNLAENYRLE